MVSFLGVLIGLLCSILLLPLFKFFHKFWWVPMRVKYVMSSQGIRGPPYSFIHGNVKEISIMIKKSTSFPMDISHYIFPRVQPHLDSWFNIYGKSILYWQGPQAELVLTEPELLKEIMSVREISMGKQDVGSTFNKIFGRGIVFSQGERWAKQRKLATHSFNGERLKNIVPTMVESVDMMLKRWKEVGTKEKEVYEEFKIMTSDVISRIVFGSNYEEGNQIFQKQGALILLAAKHMSKIRLPGLGMILKDKEEIETDKLVAGINDIIMKIIRNREKTMNSGDQDNSMTDYLGLLLKARYDIDDSYKLSIHDIIDECKTFYTAGHGTLSLLLSWVVFLLAIHTEWQEKAREEVREIFGNQNPSSEGIARLKIMGMIINETMIFKDKEDLESDKLIADIRDIIMMIIRSREKMIVSGHEHNSTTDYIGILLKASRDIDCGYKLSIQDIIDECRTFYIVGHGTVSLLLTWVTLLLGIHTEWQEKAREEVQKVFGNQNPSSEGIARLKTMGMIINETLRLYPPAVSATRKVLKETRVGNLVLPANLNIQILSLPLHQDPQVWGEDAHLFKPERFLEGPHIDSWFHIYGKNILYWRGPQAELVVTEPELLKEIMSLREISMGKQDVGPVLNKIFGDGLVFSHGDKWAKQRKLATHAFNGERLKNIVPVVVESVGMTLKQWKNAGTEEIEVYEEFRIMTSQVISRMVFGSNYEEGKKIFQKLGALTPLAAKSLSKTRLLGFGMICKDKDDAETDTQVAGIRDIIMKMIRNREKMMIIGDEDSSMTDYLGILLKARLDTDDNYKLTI
ncbi:hypothetical protein L1987_61680 [Smallanthus sonchifolius]|uniref:Uncharacterized protein n=1 Tax=Smallanthus sonchifolius TaxID=185202 RepID=A0ACB9C8C7_9ASTR|nr:hypothetical protein L1987_61680 [Smallanthus sonchifolius]